MSFYNSSQGTTNIDCDDIQVVDQKVSGTLDLSDATVIWDNSTLINFPVDNTTINFNGLNQIQVKDGGITDVKTNFTDLENSNNLTTRTISCSAFTTDDTSLSNLLYLNFTPNSEVSGLKQLFVNYIQPEVTYGDFITIGGNTGGTITMLDNVNFNTKNLIDINEISASAIITTDLDVNSIYPIGNILNIGGGSMTNTVKMIDNLDMYNHDIVNVKNLTASVVTADVINGLLSLNYITLDAGSSTQPAIRWLGDTQTGIYSNGGGNISFTDNGTDYAYFESGVIEYYLGIPQKQFTFNQNGLIMPQLSNISWLYNSPLTETGFYSSTNQIQVLTDDIVRATFNNSGLAVTGLGSFTSTLSTTGNAYITGNVGIGVTLPSNKLSILSSSTDATNIRLENSSSNRAYTMNVLGSGVPTNAGNFVINDVTGVALARFSISTLGYAGIGTNNPSGIFDVNFNLSAYPIVTPALRLTNSNFYGQSALDYYINNTLRGRIRTDYNGNLNYVTNGGDHYWYTGGDSGTGTNRMILNTFGQLQLGSNTAVGTSGPIYINLGGTYGTNAGGNDNNLKLRLYDDGTNRYGLGMSAGMMELQCPLTVAYEQIGMFHANRLSFSSRYTNWTANVVNGNQTDFLVTDNGNELLIGYIQGYSNGGVGRHIHIFTHYSIGLGINFAVVNTIQNYNTAGYGAINVATNVGGGINYSRLRVTNNTGWNAFYSLTLWKVGYLGA